MVGASVGFRVAPADGTEPDQLLRNRHGALRAKSEGRKGTYASSSRRWTRMRKPGGASSLICASALSRANLSSTTSRLSTLRRNQCGFEALVALAPSGAWAWSHHEFIPLAEETGLIVPLANGSCGRLVPDATRWPAQINIAVNLSPIQFKSRHLIQTVISALAASGLSPGRLELEITESVLLQDSEATLTTLHRLREHRRPDRRWTILEPGIPRSAICGAFHSTRSRSTAPSFTN